MLKYILLLIFSISCLAQSDNFDSENDSLHEYFSLNDNKIFDVEIIVFAYNNALPNNKTYANKALFSEENALILQAKPEDIPFIKLDDSPKIQDDEVTGESELTVSINDNQEDKEVLAWFLHEPENYSLESIWNKLANQSNIVPLIHNSWRQTDSSFDNPIHIKLSNVPSNESNEGVDYDNYTINVSSDDDIYLSEEEKLEEKLNNYPDMSITGKVSLSQGRFMHFGHNLNLIRHYLDENNNKRSMVFSLTERKQMKSDELHYFDSPWFGSLVKITEYKGDEEE